MAQEIKTKALDLALSQIEKQFGKGSIMKLGEQAISTDIAVIPTGSLGLDIALGVGGLPRGRVIEIYGPESSGKTTLALECIAEAQKLGGIGARQPDAGRSPARPSTSPRGFGAQGVRRRPGRGLRTRL